MYSAKEFVLPQRPVYSPQLRCKALQQQVEVSFCTGKACKKQGAAKMLKFGKDLGLNDVNFTSCGCLKYCGQGPNTVVQNTGEVYTTVDSEQKVLQLIQIATGQQLGQNVIDSVKLRIEGNLAAYDEDFQQAIDLYTKAIAMDPQHGLHILYSNRSAAKLQSGDKDGAVKDAQLAVENAPKNWDTAYIRLIDALYAIGNFQKALEALKTAVETNPLFTTSPHYKAIVTALDAKV